MRRTSRWADLTVTSIPVEPTEAILTVIASGDEADQPYATAMATLQRPPRAEHEELWAQFFIDDVFVDVVRVLEIDQGIGTERLFVARARVPELQLDGQTHRARVRFVTAVSRTVPRGTSSATAAPTETGASAEAACDFVGSTARLRARGGD